VVYSVCPPGDIHWGSSIAYALQQLLLLLLLAVGHHLLLLLVVLMLVLVVVVALKKQSRTRGIPQISRPEAMCR
jgi:hypothetical protein